MSQSSPSISVIVFSVCKSVASFLMALNDGVRRRKLKRRMIRASLLCSGPSDLGTRYGIFAFVGVAWAAIAVISALIRRSSELW